MTTPLQLKLVSEGQDPHERMGKYTPWEAFHILNDYLKEGSQVPVEVTAQKVLNLIPETDYGPVTFQEHDLSFVLVQTARQIPYWHPSQARLVALMHRLAKSSKLCKVARTKGISTMLRTLSFTSEVQERHWRMFPFSSFPC